MWWTVAFTLDSVEYQYDHLVPRLLTDVLALERKVRTSVRGIGVSFPAAFGGTALREHEQRDEEDRDSREHGSFTWSIVPP